MANEQDAARDGGLRAQISVRQVVRDQMTGSSIPDGFSSEMPEQPVFSSSDPDVQYDVGVICSVRTDEDREYSDRYVALLEGTGIRVFYPPRDTDQIDPGGGLRILRDNFYRGFLMCREIHIIWNPNSQGSMFDLGLCFAIRKPLRVVNPVRRTPEKSFQNAILDWQSGNLGVAEQAIYNVEPDSDIETR
jgi:hypothetical protein